MMSIHAWYGTSGSSLNVVSTAIRVPAWSSGSSRRATATWWVKSMASCSRESLTCGMNGSVCSEMTARARASLEAK
ncbi:hypothetical protein SRIMM317S_02961 [Streptomyces rimosus subsp. rimosus]